MGAVGGADLDEPRAGAGHDVGHAEGAADLDQLAARDDGLAPLGQRVERQQHRGGIVVDDGRVLGAGQLAEQAAQMTASRSPRRPPARSNSSASALRMAVDRGLDRLLGEQRAAEIGVQHGAGQVEDRAHASAAPRPRGARQRAGGDRPRRARRRRRRRRERGAGFAHRCHRQRRGRGGRSAASAAGVRSTWSTGGEPARRRAASIALSSRRGRD